MTVDENLMCSFKVLKPLLKAKTTGTKPNYSKVN